MPDSITREKKMSHSRRMKMLEEQSRKAAESGLDFSIGPRRSRKAPPIIESQLSQSVTDSTFTPPETMDFDEEEDHIPNTEDMSDDEEYGIDSPEPTVDDDYYAVKREPKTPKSAKRSKTPSKDKFRTPSRNLTIKPPPSVSTSEIHEAPKPMPVHDDPFAICNVFKNIHFLVSGFDEEENNEVKLQIRKGNGRIIEFNDILDTREHILTASKYVLIYGNYTQLERKQQNPSDLYSYPQEVLVALALDIKILKRTWVDKCLELQKIGTDQTNPNLPEFFVEKVGVITVNNIMNQVLQEPDTRNIHDLKPKMRNRVYQGGISSFYVCATSKQFKQFYTRFLKTAGAKLIESPSSITFETVVLAENETSLTGEILKIINTKELHVVSQYYVYACVVHRKVHPFTEEFLLLQSQIDKARMQKQEEQNRRKAMLIRTAGVQKQKNMIVPDFDELALKASKTPSKPKIKTPKPVKKVALIPNQGLYIKVSDSVERYIVNDCVQLENPPNLIVLIASFFEERDLKTNQSTRKFTGTIFKKYSELPDSIREMIASESNAKMRKLKEQSIYLSDETHTGLAANIKCHFRVLKSKDKNSIYCPSEETEVGVSDLNNCLWNNPLHPYSEYTHESGYKIPRDVPISTKEQQKRKMLFILYDTCTVKAKDHIIKENYQRSKLLDGTWAAGNYVRLVCKDMEKNEGKPTMLEVFGLLRKFTKETNKQKKQHIYSLTLTQFTRSPFDPLCLQKSSKKVIRIDTIRQMDRIFIVGDRLQIPPNSTSFYYL